MKKNISLVAAVIFIIMLSGCNTSKVEDKLKEVIKTIPSVTETSNNTTEKDAPKENNTTKEQDKPERKHTLLTPPDLNTENGIKEYLNGNWIFDKDNDFNMACEMNIDENLYINFYFTDTKTGESMGDYSGQIILERQYAKEEQAPDIINIELYDDNFCGGYYFFPHRTTYDGKQVMSWFFAANGDGIFSCLTNEHDIMFGPEEIVFEKKSGEASSLPTRKNDKFHAVYWGRGNEKQNLWLDDVIWTPIEEYDPDPAYPDGMILYENDIFESIIYTVRDDQIQAMDGYNLHTGVVYYIETDEEGNIKYIEDAEFEAFMNYMDNPDED